MRSLPHGVGIVGLLVSMALMFGAVSWLVSDYVPAKPTEVQQLVALASSHPSARASVAQAMHQSPSPTRSDLRKMKHQVESILAASASSGVEFATR